MCVRIKLIPLQLEVTQFAEKSHYRITPIPQVLLYLLLAKKNNIFTKKWAHLPTLNITSTPHGRCSSKCNS